ncbi:MAG: exodeoxyribonuclease I [Proteobacteria bacterium]|nr:exodeoxyribonuclease I [Pseudomonadota bacterium]
MSTYLFYDIETSGLNKSFDQILQFAAIRTDLNFNIIEKTEHNVRLRLDIVISPRAIITHRIPIADCLEGITEYEAAQEIHRLLNEPGTISLGYNTLKFDDEFLRFLFHRNLLPPYTHQYAKGCNRMDILPIALIYRLYAPNQLKWPEDQGKMSMKLEHLNQLNNLSQGQAHNAMVDVEATLELARRLSQNEAIWGYLRDNFNKTIDAERAGELPTIFENSLGEFKMGLMLGVNFGAEQNYQVPVLSIGHSRPYKNQSLWLRLDLPELIETTKESIEESTWVIRKRFGEPGILLPPLTRYKVKIGSERWEAVDSSIQWLKENPEILTKIMEYHKEFKYAEIPDLDPDAILYQMGFLDHYEQKLCREFHEKDVAGKEKMLSRFARKELKILAERLLFRNFEQKEKSREISTYMATINPEHEDKALLDFRGDQRTTPAHAHEEIQLLRSEGELDQDQSELLVDLENYLRDRF